MKKVIPYSRDISPCLDELSLAPETTLFPGISFKRSAAFYCEMYEKFSFPSNFFRSLAPSSRENLSYINAGLDKIPVRSSGASRFRGRARNFSWSLARRTRGQISPQNEHFPLKQTKYVQNALSPKKEFFLKSRQSNYVYII